MLHQRHMHSMLTHLTHYLLLLPKELTHSTKYFSKIIEPIMFVVSTIHIYEIRIYNIVINFINDISNLLRAYSLALNQRFNKLIPNKLILFHILIVSTNRIHNM